MRVRVCILALAAALAAAAGPQAAGATSGDEATRAAPGAEASGGAIHAALAAAAAGLAEAALAREDGQAGAGPAEPAPAASGSRAEGEGAVLGVSARSRRPRLHRIAVVRGEVALSERPGGPAVLRLGSRTEFGSKRVLGVAARRRGWLGVVATGRPNNRLAWVRREDPGLRLRRTGYSLHADLSARTLILRKDGRRLKLLPVAVGRPGSETPTGRFVVTDKLSGSSYGPYYGCCILALSGIQPNTPPGWTGGNRLAIHGTDSPSTIGAAASAGCLRASDADLRPLMSLVPLGTPVFIRR
jgi:hypothetical protein